MPDYFTLLRDRVTLKCRSIDRIFLQAYVPKLQSVGQVCSFLRWQRQFKIPSSAAFGKIGDAYVEAVYDFAKAHHIPVVHFQKGQNKEKIGATFSGGCGSGRQGTSRVDWHRSREGLRPGAPGNARVRRKPLIRTWNGAGKWPTSTISTSTSGTRTGVALSGRPTPMRPIQSGSGSTVMSGPSGNWRKPALVTRLSTMGSVLVKIPPPCKGSATGSGPGR